MAGDWIKMRHNLDTDPRVIEMAAELNLPELHVIGCLWKLWVWADQHTISGNAIRVTDVTLDRFTCVTGFAKSLKKIGWLEGENNELSFPRFTEHNGQTAKKRAETKERVQKHRNAKSVTDVTQKRYQRREEKRREDRVSKDTLPASADDEKIQQLISKWNALGSPRVRTLTAERKKRILVRLKDPGWLEAAIESIDKLPVANDEKFNWQPDFDWLIKNATNAVKLAEGAYDKKEPASHNRTPTKEQLDNWNPTNGGLT